MSFAKRQMEAMGWKEGMGLGANEDGITTAIKPKLKFNNNGIGFEDNQFCNQWWNQSFNCSANHIDFKLKRTQTGLRLSRGSAEDQYESPKANKYSNFVESSGSESKTTEAEEEEEVSVKVEPKITETIDFDKVFRKSGGRTGHKGSRHGIKMGGKLKRIEEQNNEFIKKFKRSEDK